MLKYSDVFGASVLFFIALTFYGYSIAQKRVIGDVQQVSI
jgi:hypothetical protein